MSAVAEKAGFFDWAASLTARAGGGSVLRLYGFVFLVRILITASLSLDATAIVLTPIMYGMVVRLRLSPLPFMFACVYTANTASIFLPISNLTNLLVYDTFDLGFVRFGLIMLIPSTLAVLANVLVLAGLFRKNLLGGRPFDGHLFAHPTKRHAGDERQVLAQVARHLAVSPLAARALSLSRRNRICWYGPEQSCYRSRFRPTCAR